MLGMAGLRPWIEMSFSGGGCGAVRRAVGRPDTLGCFGLSALGIVSNRPDTAGAGRAGRSGAGSGGGRGGRVARSRAAPPEFDRWMSVHLPPPPWLAPTAQAGRSISGAGRLGKADVVAPVGRRDPGQDLCGRGSSPDRPGDGQGRGPGRTAAGQGRGPSKKDACTEGPRQVEGPAGRGPSGTGPVQGLVLAVQAGGIRRDAGSRPSGCRAARSGAGRRHCVRCRSGVPPRSGRRGRAGAAPTTAATRPGSVPAGQG